MASVSCLDAAPGLVGCVPGQNNHGEGSKDSGGVSKLVVDGVLVAVERMSGDLDSIAESIAACLESALVDFTGTARHQIQNPGLNPPALVTDKIDHAGEFLRALFGLVEGLGRDVMADVFVDAKTPDPYERVSSSAAA